MYYKYAGTTSSLNLAFEKKSRSFQVVGSEQSVSWDKVVLTHKFDSKGGKSVFSFILAKNVLHFPLKSTGGWVWHLKERCRVEYHFSCDFWYHSCKCSHIPMASSFLSSKRTVHYPYSCTAGMNTVWTCWNYKIAFMGSHIITCSCSVWDDVRCRFKEVNRKHEKLLLLAEILLLFFSSAHQEY